MKRPLALLLCILLSAFIAHAQKKPLDHSVYDSWQSIANPKISNDGKYAVYAIDPQEGDGRLVITNINKNQSISVSRGYEYVVSSNSKIVVSLIKPQFEQTREAKIKKKKENEMPKDSLAIIFLESNKVQRVANVKSYKLPKESAEFLAYELSSADTTKGKDKKESYTLVVRNISNKEEDSIKNVSEYVFSEDGKLLAAAIAPKSKDSLDYAGVLLYNTSTKSRKMVSSGKGSYKQLCFDKAGSQLAFVAEKNDPKADPKIYSLFYFSISAGTALELVKQTTPGMPSKWAVSEHIKPTFNKEGTSIYFGTAPIPAPKDTTIYEFETAQLDIWHYADDYNQPMQLKNLEKDKKRSYTAVLHLDSRNKIIQLADENVYSINVNEETEEKKSIGFAMGIADKQYRAEQQWLGEIKKDIYTISLKTGEKKLVKKALSGQPTLSPCGQYIIWYDRKERQYYSYNISNQTTICLTSKLGVNIWDEKNDVPDDPSPYGIGGWLEGGKAVLIYDAYDIWQIDPSGKLPAINLTNSIGRTQNLTFRYLKTITEKEFILQDELLLLKAFNNVTRENGFYTKSITKVKEEPILRAMGEFTFSTPVKAKNSNTFIFTKSNFSTTPDLHATSDWWGKSTRLSRINTQMKDYLWGTVELIQYKTYDSINAEALLYKPENFDPQKKYPMLIYFYEKHTDDLYKHYAPAPSRSIINIPFFVSRGYIVLVPDIYYTDGHPGESAYNSVVAVAEEVSKNPWVDKAKIGIQGQSWGGYQVSYLVTRTNMFKAAGAGAPVSNMTSAYGGVRWGTGMIRQFQYEHTQSRIGKTLWDGFDLYIENSPLFFADKVETPLLIMHNDNDGAVPWYQGIEYFTALRRLGKKVWMLQYNKEEHNLLERKNTKDLSIRLQQFFDHYLKGDKMPKWMKYGVPATQKGADWGYELVN